MIKNCEICNKQFNDITSSKKRKYCSSICLGITRKMEFVYPDDPSKISALKEYFDKKVVKNEKGCWSWTGYKCNGYGDMQAAGIRTQAHRASWIIHKGNIPDGLQVLHDCPDGDNPECTNPQHLWLGTQLDNMRDMIKKGRKVLRPKGSIPHNRKINDEIALEIKKMLSNKILFKDIARDLNISVYIVGDIAYGKTWKHIKIEE